MTKKKRIALLVQRANLLRPIAAVLLGKHHKPSHRMALGVVVMAAGISIYKGGEHFDSTVIAFVTDGIGFFVHGMGLVPFLEHLAEAAAAE